MDGGIATLFGSFARDEAGPDGDIDLAAAVFDPANKMDLIRLVGLEREVGELLGWPVEIPPETVRQSRLRAHVDRDRIFVF